MPVFVGTNVLVYARGASEPDKQPRARDWMDLLWERRSGRSSVQVLRELYVVVTRNLAPGLSVEEARLDVRDLPARRPPPADSSLMEAAWAVQDRHPVSFWDALVVAAADRLSCEHLLTEDLEDGYDFGSTRVLNPFLHHPEELDR